jgi:hypothetical protein
MRDLPYRSASRATAPLSHEWPHSRRHEDLHSVLNVEHPNLGELHVLTLRTPVSLNR